MNGAGRLIACALVLSVGRTALAQNTVDPPEETESQEAETRGEQNPPDAEQAPRARGAFTAASDPEDPQNLLPAIVERNREVNSLFPVSPLRGLHELSDQARADLKEAANLEFGLAIVHLFQWVDDSLPGADTYAAGTNLDLVGNWEIFDVGGPTQGQIFAHLQGRWDYGTIGPENLAGESLGGLAGTANTFSAYQPAFIIRNLYWQQGSREAGWAYRIGKITPDATFGTSKHIAAATTFLSTASVGTFANGYADSGLGVAGAIYPSENMTILALVSDANADRTDFGDIGEGDFYKAIEFGYKIAPRTENAGYSKLAFWHTDGTSDGEPANGQLGPDGWGFFIKYEQELDDDGDAIAVVKYGRSFDDSAFYERQLTTAFLYYNPSNFGNIRNDVVGAAFNWIDSPLGERDEYHLETFYRFPVFPGVDMTLHYQAIFDPALDLGIDDAHVFSLRFRTTF